MFVVKDHSHLFVDSKTWERATMGEERLCAFAMLHVPRDMNVSREIILIRLDETGHMKIGTLQFE